MSGYLKAFNIVLHNILISELEKYGLDRFIIGWAHTIVSHIQHAIKNIQLCFERQFEEEKIFL